MANENQVRFQEPPTGRFGVSTRTTGAPQVQGMQDGWLLRGSSTAPSGPCVRRSWRAGHSDGRISAVSTANESAGGSAPASLTRSQVVQRVLDLFDDASYLEVGVSRGATFHSVRARRKTAVDPAFQFDVESARLSDPTASYYEVTSDSYFGTIVDSAEQFTVIFLDGLHTFEQTLRDFTNALSFVARPGVIVIDDVLPSTYLAAMSDFDDHRRLRRALKIHDVAWMGDVYRLVFFIEAFFQQITYRTVAENHGQLIAWRSRRAAVAERSVEEVARLGYERSVLERDVFAQTPLEAILFEVRTDLCL